MPKATLKDCPLGCCKALKANEKQIFGGESGKKVGVWISLYYHVDWEWVYFCLYSVFHGIVVQIFRQFVIVGIILVVDATRIPLRNVEMVESVGIV